MFEPRGFRRDDYVDCDQLHVPGDEWVTDGVILGVLGRERGEGYNPKVVSVLLGVVSVTSRTRRIIRISGLLELLSNVEYLFIVLTTFVRELRAKFPMMGIV